MAGKKVSFGTKPQKQPDVDAWVENREAPTEPEAEEKTVVEQPLSVEGNSAESVTKAQSKAAKMDPGAMKRLTLDIPETLHRRIKGRAVMEGVTMVNMLRELLQETYG